MKKLLFAIMAAFAFAACDKDEHQTRYQDMMCFVESIPTDDGYASATTHITAASDASALQLYVMRSPMAAGQHPRQTARIVVDKENSTAIEGTDFSLSATTFDFENSEVFRPFTIDFHDAAEKTIALELDYAYYDECPADTRKQDRLTIEIK